MSSTTTIKICRTSFTGQEDARRGLLNWVAGKFPREAAQAAAAPSAKQVEASRFLFKALTRELPSHDASALRTSTEATIKHDIPAATSAGPVAVTSQQTKEEFMDASTKIVILKAEKKQREARLQEMINNGTSTSSSSR